VHPTTDERDPSLENWFRPSGLFRMNPFRHFGKLRSTALGYGLNDRGFESRPGLEIFLFITVSRPALGPIQRVPGTLSLRAKRPGREADHSPASSAEITDAWNYTFTPQYVFMAWCSVKAQGLIYFLLLPFTSLDGKKAHHNASTQKSTTWKFMNI
jgi:hypothetical protein